ncbi:PREDICTED: E3 ubiquitin-protein ligase RHA1B-like [Camelina sativa]|uniref:E3 ubiquitin-protein ligase RHA1B-like n=1 Tax=Camelina sativa TaxID=90675 RepID=A0ABM0T1L8_CAMSA|nr:PREDICTED: E3 ubiquitin-protein ligase RHA1B-like [Camelina sativa]
MGFSYGGAGVIIVGVILNDFIRTVRSFLDHPRLFGVYWSESSGRRSTISSGTNKIPIDDMLPATTFEEMSSRVNPPPESCRICQEEFDCGEEVRCLRNCVHVYHKTCIDRWIQDDKMTCPLCRTPIVPDFYFFRL